MPHAFCLSAFAFLFLTATSHAQTPVAATPDDWVFLDNGRVRLGVLRSSGAGVGFFAPSGGAPNLLNHYDRGRLLQQSYYGDEDGSVWVQNPWRYNPVQGGDYHGQGARVLDLRTDGKQLYAKTVPRHWATGEELTECVMEEWITLEDVCAHVHYQFTYNGSAKHEARHQEIPAMFVDAALATLVAYQGEAPWTGDALTRGAPGSANEYLKISEHWAAYVNAQDFGVGLYVPVAQEATCYRFQGANGSACSYVAPLTTFPLLPGTVFSYDCYLTTGTVAEIRAMFTKLHAANP